MELRARGSRFALPPCGTANPFCVRITLGQRLGEARIAAPERGQTATTNVGLGSSPPTFRYSASRSRSFRGVTCGAG